MNISKGAKIIFKGYSEKPEKGQDFLKKGSEHVVVDTDPENKSVTVRIDNPNFNPKKKESDENTKTMLLDVFEEELEVKSAPSRAAAAASKSKAKAPVATEDEGEDDEEEEDEEEEEEAPPAKTKGKAPAKAAPVKAKAKAAPAKGKTKAKPEAEEAESEDPYGDLTEENEDAEILGLVNEAESLLDLAKETAEEASAVEYKLGGILFHVRKTGAYKELDDKFSEKGGFGLYVLEHLNVEYRKAMYLIDIYYKWNKFGLDSAKVASIGWAKAAKIAAVMTEDTAEELLELAEGNTVADLVENIKTNYKEVGGQKGEKKMLKTFKFRLFEDQAAAVEEVLNSVAAAMEFKNLDLAFEHIVMEWATEHPVEKKTTSKTTVKKTAPTKAKASA